MCPSCSSCPSDNFDDFGEDRPDLRCALDDRAGFRPALTKLPLNKPALSYDPQLSKTRVEAHIAECPDSLIGMLTAPSVVSFREIFRSILVFSKYWIMERINPTAIDDLLSWRICDRLTMSNVEFEKLYSAVSNCGSNIGQLAMRRALLQPCQSALEVQGKQEALHELSENPALRNWLQKYIAKFAKKEECLIKLVNDKWSFNSSYSDYFDTKEAVRNLGKELENAPAPSSPYLKALFSQITGLKNGKLFALFDEGIVRTPDGLKTPSEVGGRTSRWRFYPVPFSWGVIAAGIVSAFSTLSIIGILSAARFETWDIQSSLLGSGMVLGGLAITYACMKYGLQTKQDLDNLTIRSKLSDIAVNDKYFVNALEAFGHLSELFGYLNYMGNSQVPMTFPECTDSDRLLFRATGMRAPLRASDPSFVANDVDLTAPITCITGPNSGGKTTTCKTIAHFQLLAQNGCAVPATSGRISPADYIGYQAPMFDSLDDKEGRFGTEIAVTSKRFFSSTQRSLNILDELGEGTTFEEKTDIGFEIMRDFGRIGGRTILTTHNHELVRMLAEKALALTLCTQFETGNPTYKIKHGISETSHAERLVEHAGFSAAHREEYIQSHTAPPPEMS